MRYLFGILPALFLLAASCTKPVEDSLPPSDFALVQRLPLLPYSRQHDIRVLVYYQGAPDDNTCFLGALFGDFLPKAVYINGLSLPRQALYRSSDHYIIRSPRLNITTPITWRVVNPADSFSFVDANAQPFFKEAHIDTTVTNNQLLCTVDGLVNTDSLCITLKKYNNDIIIWQCIKPADSVWLDIPATMRHGEELLLSFSAYTHQDQTINGASYLFIREYQTNGKFTLK